jgi:hypothetical protein
MLSLPVRMFSNGWPTTYAATGWVQKKKRKGARELHEVQNLWLTINMQDDVCTDMTSGHSVLFPLHPQSFFLPLNFWLAGWSFFDFAPLHP